MLDRILSQNLSQIDRAAGGLAVVVVVVVVVVVISSTLFLFSIFSRTYFFLKFHPCFHRGGQIVIFNTLHIAAAQNLRVLWHVMAQNRLPKMTIATCGYVGTSSLRYSYQIPI